MYLIGTFPHLRLRARTDSMPCGFVLSHESTKPFHRLHGLVTKHIRVSSALWSSAMPQPLTTAEQRAQMLSHGAAHAAGRRMDPFGRAAVHAGRARNLVAGGASVVVVPATRTAGRFDSRLIGGCWCAFQRISAHCDYFSRIPDSPGLNRHCCTEAGRLCWKESQRRSPFTAG